jgi:hypothetical protein
MNPCEVREVLRQLRELRVHLSDKAYHLTLRHLNQLIRRLETSLGYQPIDFDD